DLAVEAERLPQEDGRRGLAVGDGRYVHAYMMSRKVPQYKQIIYTQIDRVITYMTTLGGRKSAITFNSNHFTELIAGTSD
ncbi:MAG TPA: hypothetical protein VKM93_15140, partial [Terriglobia bacterium]|nr:hypothetical protein [Terriglobia bacterium]